MLTSQLGFSSVLTSQCAYNKCQCAHKSVCLQVSVSVLTSQCAYNKCQCAYK